MIAKKLRAHRQHHLGRGEVPDPELGLSKRRRAPVSPASSPGCRAGPCATNVTINNLLPALSTRTGALELPVQRKASGKSYEELRKARAEANPAAASAASRNSAMPAPICAARRRVTLPARICCWTAALTRGRSDVKRISCLIAFLLCAEIACAQSYPARAVKVVVPWPRARRRHLGAQSSRRSCRKRWASLS